MRRRDLATLILALAAAFALGVWLRWSHLPGQDASGNATVVEALADRSYPMAEPEDADVTLVVFTDYRCPACRKSDPEMQRAVAADGRVRVIYRDWPIFGPPSEETARLALAAARQGIYPKLHHRLMQAGDPLADLPSQVAAAGGDPAQVRRDSASHRGEIDTLLARTARDAMALGFRGTPSYVIGTRVIEGALSEAQFRKAFAAARDPD